MGLAHDLLQLANRMAAYEGPNHSQAALRRSVSTAYYALFHLLTEDAGQRWQGSIEAATGLERALNHGPMKATSIQFKNLNWKDWHGVVEAVPPALRSVSRAFINLQEERHAADYDNHVQWTITDVDAVLDTAAGAFQDWLSIRSHPMAGNYLLSMLLGKQR